MSTINFYRDLATGVEFVAVRFMNLLLVAHEGNVATYKAIVYDPIHYMPIEPRWSGEQLRVRLIDWANDVSRRFELGVQVISDHMQATAVIESVGALACPHIPCGFRTEGKGEMAQAQLDHHLNTVHGEHHGE